MSSEQIIVQDKQIELRQLKSSDVRRPRRFLEYINNLIDDPEAMILFNRRQALIEEQLWLRHAFESVRNRKMVTKIAEHERRIVGIAHAALHEGNSEHVAELGIAIIREYRGIGLGRILMERLIQDCGHNLSPKPVMIRLSVFEDNQSAKILYGKLGFIEVARIPGQFQYQGHYVDEIVMIRQV